MPSPPTRRAQTAVHPGLGKSSSRCRCPCSCSLPAARSCSLPAAQLAHAGRPPAVDHLPPPACPLHDRPQARRPTTLTAWARTGGSPPTTGRRWPRTATSGGGGASAPWRSEQQPACPLCVLRCIHLRLPGPRSYRRLSPPSSAGRLPACAPRFRGRGFRRGTASYTHPRLPPSLLQSSCPRPRPRPPLPCAPRRYFHAYRIDHILGFFRIWEIPSGCVTGLLGHFRPSLPLWRHELEGKGIWDFDRWAGRGRCRRGRAWAGVGG